MDFDFEAGTEFWGPLSPESWFELEGDTVLRVDQADERFFGPRGMDRADGQVGVRLNDIEEALKATKPHPGLPTREAIPNAVLRHESWLTDR